MNNKTKNLRVGLPEVNLKKESKFQPPPVPDRPSNKLGQSHDFNTMGKSTSNAGSSYHDMTPGSGSKGNFAEKDASAEYLKQRGMKGQVINEYSGNTRHDRTNTGYHGQTIYPSSPIKQVYSKADCCNDTPDPAEKKYK